MLLGAPKAVVAHGVLHGSGADVEAERVAGSHTESDIMPLADTFAVQDVVAEIADQLDIRVVEGPAELP